MAATPRPADFAHLVRLALGLDATDRLAPETAPIAARAVLHLDGHATALEHGRTEHLAQLVQQAAPAVDAPAAVVAPVERPRGPRQ